MANNSDHQASPSTTVSSASASAAGSAGVGEVFLHLHRHQYAADGQRGAAMNDENLEPRERNIPVPVLVKHEEYAVTAATSGDQSGDESSTSLLSNGHDASKRPREKRSTKSKCPPGLRSGKWTPEEEAFTNLIIYYFKLGRLHVEDGTSLRWYLAKRLNCEAMRVTKKLKGNSSIGKQIFRALEDTDENRRAIEAAGEELAVLEKAFDDSLSATGQPGTNAAGSISGSAAAVAAARAKRASPHKPMGLPKPPHLEARKLVIPKVRDSLANSEDAKLLMHFFVGANDATSLDDDISASGAVEKKRLFSEVDSSSTSSQSASPESKRRSVKMEDLVGPV